MDVSTDHFYIVFKIRPQRTNFWHSFSGLEFIYNCEGKTVAPQTFHNSYISLIQIVFPNHFKLMTQLSQRALKMVKYNKS